MLSDEQIKDILHRYRTGNCSNEERAAIDGWYDRMLSVNENPILESDETALSERMKTALYKRLGFNISGLQKKLNKPYRYLIAASVTFLIMAGAGFYYKINHSKNDYTVKADRKEQDISPGTNKAVLTLSDGSRVILDSSVNKNASANINKNGITDLSNGTLTYQNNHRADRNNISYNNLSTPRGGVYQLVLSDGTKVWLNAETTLRYPTAFTGKERVVELIGEAYFEVVHNDKMPFSVKTGNKIIQDLGTHFNVNAYPDEANTHVTLLEGKVKVSEQGSPKSVTLKPGEEAHMSQNGNISISENANMDAVIAWKNGLFYFNDKTDIRIVMGDIARWYNVDIQYEGAPPKMQFGGKITRNCNLSEVLKILEYSNVHCTIEGNKIVVSQ